MAVWSSIHLNDLGEGFRLDPEFYQPDYIKYEKLVAYGDDISSVCPTIIHPVEFERKYEEFGLPILLAQNIRPLRLVFGTRVFMPEKYRSLIEKNRLECGDLVMTRSGANYGDTACFVAPPNGYKEYYASADCLILRPKEIPSGYLATYLNTAMGLALVRRGGYGGGQPHIAPSYLRTFRIPRLGRAEYDIDARVVSAWKAQEMAGIHLSDAESLMLSALDLNLTDLVPSRTYSRPFKDLLSENRFDAEYFGPRLQSILLQLRKSGVTIGDVAPLVKRIFRPSEFKDGTFKYIEIGSLTGDGDAEPATIEISDAPSRAQFVVKAGDIITSTVRPIRRLSAMIRPEQDGCVCSSGFAVLSPHAGDNSVEPEVLLTYLRLPIICEILDLYTTATMYPAIPVDRLLKIPFFMPSSTVREAIVENVRAATSARKEAARLLEEAKAMVELGVIKGA